MKQSQMLTKDYIEEPRVIGIYTFEKLTQEAIERAKKLSGFGDFPKRFQITKYALDLDQWNVGFKLNT